MGTSMLAVYTQVCDHNPLTGDHLISDIIHTKRDFNPPSGDTPYPPIYTNGANIKIYIDYINVLKNR